MRDFFTSDPHFGHGPTEASPTRGSIIEYCKRPFLDIEEMDAEIIRRWNHRVKADDRLYILGDFAFGSQDYIGSVLDQLECKMITLVEGNHDGKKTAKAFRDRGFHVTKSLRLPVGVAKGESGEWIKNPHILLRHKPGVESSEKFPSQVFRLCGHVHSAWRRNDGAGYKQINVGVDVWNYYPHTLYELLGDVPYDECR